MTERSRLFQERLDAEKLGAIVFVLDPDNRVLAVEELENKSTTGKTIGQHSCLSETAIPGELPRVNVSRAFTEELGIAPERFHELLDFKDITYWETSYIEKVWASVVTIRCTDPCKLMELVGTNNKPDGVNVLGFQTRQEFEKSNLRPGVRNIMNRFGNEIFQ